METAFKITKQTFWQTIVKLTTSLSGFIILGIVSRQYGESGTGNFTLALTYLAFFYILADFSFNAHLLGKLQEQGSAREWQKLLGSRIVWSLLLMVVALVIVGLLPYQPPAFGFPLDFKLAVLLGMPTVLFYGLNITAHSLFQAKLRYQLDILPTLLGVSLGTLLIWLLSLTQAPVYLIILGYLLAWFIHSSGSLLLAARLVKVIRPIFDLGYLKQIIKEVWPMAATLVLNVIYFRADAFIIAYYHSSADVGIYNVAYQVFQAVLVLPTFMMNSFYPLMLKSLKESAGRFISQVQKAGWGLLASSLAASLIIYLLASNIMSLITGQGFIGSTTSLQILSLGLPAYFLSALGLWVMIANKMYQSMLVVYGIGLIFNLIANWLFIPQFSYLASAWITGISEYLILILQIIILRRYFFYGANY